VIVVGLWLQDQLPPAHCLVIPDDIEISGLDLRLLAGLSAIIVHDESRIKRAKALVNPILDVRPEWLAICNLERRVAATAFELGAPCCRQWGAWEWARFDGQQPLTLPDTPAREAA
jgi:hypothetical protein